MRDLDGIVCLAGPPGAGKTTAGRILASRLGIPFTDLDDLVEEIDGRSICEIFAGSGESRFREVERLALDTALGSGPCVLAVGGGCLLHPGSLAAVLEKTFLVTLFADDVILAARCAGGERPLAADAGGLLALLASRREHYLSLPRRIDTGKLTPGETVDTILSILA